MEYPLVEFKEVTIYRGNNLILHPINFSIHAGELVYIIGRSGTGKTSLLNSLNPAFQPQYEGAIYIDGTLAISSRKGNSELWRKIGLIDQLLPFFMPHKALFDNLLLLIRNQVASSDAGKQIIERILELTTLTGVQYHAIEELTPFQYQSAIIARALVTEPRLLLADQLTERLDPETGSDVMDLLISIQQQSGVAIMIVSHNLLSINRYQGRILVLSMGRLLDIPRNESQAFIRDRIDQFRNS